jgi:hypothetical protein
MRDFERFELLISRWANAYIYAIHAQVGFITPHGRRLLYGRTVFEMFSCGLEQTAFSLETEHIFAQRFIRPLEPSDVFTAIENAKEGRMGNKLVDLTPNTSPDRFTPYLTTDYHPFVATLFVRGATKHEIETKEDLPRHLEWEMKAADTPFHSLDELMVHCGLPPWTRHWDSSAFEIIAKAPAQISDKSMISDGKAIIECRGAKFLESDKWKLGHRIFAQSEIIRASTRGGSFEWREEDDVKIGRCEVRVDAPVLQVYLSYEGTPIDEKSVSDPTKHLNPRHAIHQAFDEKMEILQQMLLSPEKDKAQVFEGGVSMLLTLLGFSVSNYGRFPKLQDGPDIIAITPKGDLAVVECTTGLISQKDKVAKLVQRTQVIRNKLTNAGYSTAKVQPVIVTLLKREEITPGLDEARKHEIAIISREDFEDALNQTALPQNADQFFEKLRAFIPLSKLTSVSGLASHFDASET